MAVFFSQRPLTVTPNERQALALWEQHARERQAEGLESWETPPIASWGEFTRALWDEYWMGGLYHQRPLTLMNDWQERFLWLRVLRNSKEGEGLLNLPQASKLVQDAWRLVNIYRLEEKLQAPSSHWPADTQVFLGWVAGFQSECKQRRWLEPSRLEAELVKVLRGDLIPPRALPQTLLFRGFAEWTPSQQRLLDTLKERGVDISEQVEQEGDEPPEWGLLCCLDRVDELRTAARWLRAKLEENPDRELRVGLVIPDLAERRAEVHRVLLEVFQPSQLLQHKSADNLTHDLSAGLPLSHWRIVKDALALLALWRKYHTVQEWNVLFSSPYLGEAEQELSPRAVLWTQLLQDGRFQTERQRLEQLCRPQEEEHRAYHCPSLFRRLRETETLQKESPFQQIPSRWAELFSSELEAWGWPGERKLDSVEYQTVSRWKKLLAQFGSLDQLMGAVTREEALQSLRRVAEETVYQPKVSIGQVEVMGTLEAVGLHFDYLWLAGFHDGIWPSAARPNPYLPFSLQKEHGVAHSTPERELDFSRRISLELLRAARRGVVSYPSFHEDRHCRPSPLFSALPRLPVESLGLNRTTTVHAHILESRKVELFLDPGPPAVPVDADSRGGSSLFKHQAACPFRAFALLRMNAKPLEVVQEGLDARQRGNLLHAALEELWKTVSSSARWLSLSEAEREKTLRICAEVAVGALRRQRSDILRGLMFQLEVQRVTRLLREWMKLEESREPFEVLATEERVSLHFAGLNLQVTIDRVDRLNDGTIAVIDYKTGNPSVDDWLGERPQEPQLPLYCVADARPADIICFAKLKPGQMVFQGLGREDERIPGVKASEFAKDGTKSWSVRRAEWKRILERLADEFRRGQAQVDPVDGSKTCRTCGLQPLCRIEENRELP